MLKDLDLRVPNINQRQRVPRQAIQVLVDHNEAIEAVGAVRDLFRTKLRL